MFKDSSKLGSKGRRKSLFNNIPPKPRPPRATEDSGHDECDFAAGVLSQRQLRRLGRWVKVPAGHSQGKAGRQNAGATFLPVF